jgi:predicted nucleic acid-binding Zn ribbon protein
MSDPRIVECVVCGQKLTMDEDVDPITRGFDGKCCNIVYGGVVCEAYGNYGSTVFDPMGRQPNLSFVICDACFAAKKTLLFPIYDTVEPTPIHCDKCGKILTKTDRKIRGADRFWHFPGCYTR